MKHKIYLLTMVAIFSSCMKIKKKGEEAKPEAVAPPPVIELAQVTRPEIKELSYVYTDSLVSEVKFSIPTRWPKEIIVKKEVLGESKKFFPTLVKTDEDGTWKDALVEDAKVTYQFYTADQSQLLDEVAVLPVFDLDLQEDLNLSEKFKLDNKTKLIYFRSLSLAPNTHLLLESYSGNIIIDNLNSEAGFLQTYPEQARAAFEKNGRSGGTLNIDINSGVGSLSVVMRGESGGQGLAGQDPDASLVGANGVNGKNAVFEQLNMTSTDPFAPKYCKVKPTDGAAGAHGLRGFSGSNGGNGGHSGQAIVQSKTTELKVSSYNIAGVKGDGGIGGLGGEGGEGGKAGAYADVLNTSEPCERAKDGSRGERGPTGQPGNPGSDGILSKNQFFINGVKALFNNEN